MKLTDKFYIRSRYHGPVGSHFGMDTPSISSKPIRSLIDALSEEGIEIYVERSSMDAKYLLDNEQKEATLPLSSSVPGSTPNAYMLIGPDNLEIRLEDFDHVSDRPPKGMIGGTVSGSRGIRVTLSVESIEPAYVMKIKDTILDFYGCNRNAMNDLLGNISREDIEKLLPGDKKED